MEQEVAEVLAGTRRWWVSCGDCLEVMPRMPDGCVSHVITDPPYSRDLYSRTRTNKGSGLRPNGMPVSKSEDRPDNSGRDLAALAIGAIDDILDPSAAEMLRLATRWVIAFHDCETGDRWRAAFGDHYVRTGAWVKSNPMPQISADRPAQGFEPCTIAHVGGGRMRWNGGGLPAVWIHANAGGPGRPDHPCPKPVDLMMDMVAQFTDPGEVVIDPFCGSGTTGVACLLLGRRFIGIERNHDFATISRLRLGGRLVDHRLTKAGQLPMFPGVG